MIALLRLQAIGLEQCKTERAQVTIKITQERRQRERDRQTTRGARSERCFVFIGMRVCEKHSGALD